MEFQDVVRRRRMVRRYADRPLDSAIVDRALANALHAPSAGFSQGWAFLRLDTPAAVARFWTTTADDVAHPDRWLAGMMTAPVVIVAFSHPQAYLDRYAEADKGWDDRDPARWPVPFWDTDTAMACLLILQTAVDEGIGACFFGVRPSRVAELRAAFGVPDAFRPVGAVTLGHRLDPTPAPPRGSAATRARRPVSEVVHVGHWGERDPA